MPEFQWHHEVKGQRRLQTAQARREKLRKCLQRNGNIITGQGMPEESKLGRAHISEEPSQYMKKESRVRMVGMINIHRWLIILQQNLNLSSTPCMLKQTGGGRYHIPLSPRGARKNLRRQQPRVQQALKQRSSVIGYGRSDLQSLGTLDNFSEIPLMKARKVIP